MKDFIVLDYLDKFSRVFIIISKKQQLKRNFTTTN